jgi:hypothetical protein
VRRRPASGVVYEATMLQFEVQFCYVGDLLNIEEWRSAAQDLGAFPTSRSQVSSGGEIFRKDILGVMEAFRGKELPAEYSRPTGRSSARARGRTGRKRTGLPQTHQRVC